MSVAQVFCPNQAQPGLLELFIAQEIGTFILTSFLAAGQRLPHLHSLRVPLSPYSPGFTCKHVAPIVFDFRESYCQGCPVVRG